MQEIYKLLLKYNVNIRYLSSLCSIGYVSLLCYFKRKTIAHRSILPHIIKGSILLCDKEIAKFERLKKDLMDKDNNEFYNAENIRDMQEKQERDSKKVYKIRKLTLDV